VTRVAVANPEHAPYGEVAFVLAGAADRAAALRVRDFLTGPDGVAILARHGFSLPDG
jgi:ABC-type molybdate transport system substrate-binding protein